MKGQNNNNMITNYVLIDMYTSKLERRVPALLFNRTTVLGIQHDIAFHCC